MNGRNGGMLSRNPDIRSLMENSPEGMWRVDPRGNTTEVNAAMAMILGVPVEHIVGRNFRDFLDAETRELGEEAFRRGLDDVLDGVRAPQ